MKAEEALARLKEGNRRFVNNRRFAHDLTAQVRETSGGQSPFAVVLGCMDSRTSPELIFDQGIGDIFSVRVAGNVIDEDVLASLEFACTLAGTTLILVKGHTGCGAVAGACAADELSGHLVQLARKISPAIQQARLTAGNNTADAAFRNEVSRLNVLNSVREIAERSPVLASLAASGQIMIAGALYDVGTGSVTFYDQD
jgi:carbonic anhydrase